MNSDNMTYLTFLAEDLSSMTDMIADQQDRLEAYKRKLADFKYEIEADFERLRVSIKMWNLEDDNTEGDTDDYQDDSGEI